ncbi:MAG: esterase [Planctomycetota bacterium]|nr:MAG: esterase [Planctomycetota bacterium]
MPWTTETIGGRPAAVFEPTRAAEPQRAVLYLHGHGGKTLDASPAYTAQLERHGLFAVCPSGGRSWWLDVVYDEFHSEQTPLAYLQQTVVPWIAERWDIRPPAIGLFGISMGGQGVLQLAYRRPIEFPVVVALSPAIDFHMLYGQGLAIDRMFPDAEAARQETALLRIQGLNWPADQFLACDPADDIWFPGVERLAGKLASSGIPFEKDFETSRGGHCWEYFDAMAPRVVGFLAERTETALRRLPLAR